MTTYGAKASKPTFDVTNAADTNLSWTSELDCLKIWKEGPGTMGASGTAVIPHGLSFTPTFLVYSENYLNGNSWGINGGTGAISTAHTDGTNLNLVLPANVPYYYFIFGDTAKEQSTTTALGTGSGFGLRISKSGTTVLSKNLEDFVLTSDVPPMKIYSQGTINLDLTAGGTTFGTAHGLSFRPAFLAWGKLSSETAWGLLPWQNGGGRNLDCFSNGTNFSIRAYPGAETGTYNFRYLVFGERGI